MYLSATGNDRKGIQHLTLCVVFTKGHIKVTTLSKLKEQIIVSVHFQGVSMVLSLTIESTIKKKL